MLRFPLPSLTPSLSWPQYPDVDHHHTPLVKYLSESKANALLFIWHPGGDANFDRADGEINWDEETIGASFSAAAGTTTFSWKFDDTAEDNEEEEHEPTMEVETYVQVLGDGPLLHVIEGCVPSEIIGKNGVLVKKVKEGEIPLITNTKNANCEMPNYIQLMYIPRDTHKTIHSMFESLYMPLCEKLGKNDRTGYLSSLSKTFTRMSELKELNPPLDYDSEDDDEKKKVSVTRASAKDEDDEDADDDKGNRNAKTDDNGDDDVLIKTPVVLFLKNVTKMHNKYTVVSALVGL
ncbi:hypothetical protein SK128_019934 [Halocaridina rubra]|uniref:Uncharacterized protein n=1 Tax=Halocaridina rubra TaxID=373956 RepID=A0AAN9A8Z5_HALRR